MRVQRRSYSFLRPGSLLVPRRASEPPWKTPQDADSRGLVINLLSVAARGFTWKGNHLISRTLTGCASRELQIVVYIMGLGPSQTDCYLQGTAKAQVLAFLNHFMHGQLYVEAVASCH
ncbi:uncharacterized protein [Physcomitrium patens]|uniref:uncharacterized protein isoform X2 n=1 Tax=Physcomitrium patens TaxID=3218 RepID=UPI003CCD692F